MGITYASQLVSSQTSSLQIIISLARCLELLKAAWKTRVCTEIRIKTVYLRSHIKRARKIGHDTVYSNVRAGLNTIRTEREELNNTPRLRMSPTRPFYNVLHWFCFLWGPRGNNKTKKPFESRNTCPLSLHSIPRETSRVSGKQTQWPLDIGRNLRVFAPCRGFESRIAMVLMRIVQVSERVILLWFSYKTVFIFNLRL